MAQAKRGGGVGSMFMKSLMYLIIGGFLFALLRTFDYDPFGVINWIFEMFMGTLTRIADVFTGNDTFRRLTSAPSVLRF